MQLPVGDIKVGDRIRSDLGDVARLAASIKQVGLLHPVVVDRHGRLIAGQRRLAAVQHESLDWTHIPVTIADDLDDAARKIAEGHENVERIAFTPVEAEDYARWLREEVYGPEAEKRMRSGRPSDKLSEGSPGERQSRAKAARAAGYGATTLAKVRKVHEVAASHEDSAVRELAREALEGDLTKRKDAKVNRAYNAVMKKAKESDARKKIEETRGQDLGPMPIHGCAAAELVDHLDAGSVDLVFTDPPYPEEFLPAWSELGELAAKVLKPGGLLVAYTGQLFLPQVMERIGEHLDYWWCYAIVHQHAFFQMKIRHAQVMWKPLLVYRKTGGTDLPEWHIDLVTEGKQEKSEHFAGGEWQQSEAEAAYWIGKLTEPGGLVVDPFVGSGTTAAVCKREGRRFVGCDKDPAAVVAARERVA